MVLFHFRRRAGAAADVAELEYVIALSQTSEQIRENATISSIDVMRFLRSRYNLHITHAQSIELVRSLTGGNAFVEEIASKRRSAQNKNKNGDIVTSSSWKERLRFPFRSSSSRRRSKSSQKRSDDEFVSVNNDEEGSSESSTSVNKYTEEQVPREGRRNLLPSNASVSASESSKASLVTATASKDGDELPEEYLEYVEVKSCSATI